MLACRAARAVAAIAFAQLIFSSLAVDSAHAQYGATARVRGDAADEAESASSSTVTRSQLEERLPRSTPDALRWEAGVYVQQTAHAQASPFVRGMTGQQVVHLFDGVRMNNGLYRLGPNQYFFTVDSQSVQRLEVERGSASVRWGSDALGGAILAYPIEPFLDASAEGIELHPRVFGRFGTADLERGGRLQLEASIGPDTGVLVGAGHRVVDDLESGGVVPHFAELPDDTGGALRRGLVAPWVPRFAEEAEHPDDPDAWRTQLGTGFREGTFDGRIVRRLPGGLRVIGAVYGYRQYDAPRTDQCPPPEAPIVDCLRIDEQFRTLSYVALRGEGGGDVRDVDLILSYQRHHERRVRDRRESSRTEDVWRDDVDTFGIAFRASTRDFDLGERGYWKVRYGMDAYSDQVSSSAFQEFTDVGLVFEQSRGQYLDGSSYISTGLFGEIEARPLDWLTTRGGVRASVVGARAPADPESATRAVNRELGAAVGRAGVAIRATDELELFLNVDQGFRAPNLDDLTSRQQAGPGFQFENPDLRPERTNTFELGAKTALEWIVFEAWAFATMLEDGIVRAVREAEDCPRETPACSASWSQYQLVNADQTSWILGGELWGTAYLPADFAVRATIAYAWGEGPNTGFRETEGTSPFGERVPLSRMPPLNGTVEVRWRHVATGVYAAAGARWALDQTRLAPSDLSDPRIPIGGTPGYGVFDLRVGWRHRDVARVSLLFENVFDAAYRVHGSSVNGPGRGLVLAASLGF